jgi:hypothetical protein
MYARSMLVAAMLVLSWAGAHAEGGESNNLAALEVPGSTGIYNRMVDPQSIGTADGEWPAPPRQMLPHPVSTADLEWSAQSYQPVTEPKSVAIAKAAVTAPVTTAAVRPLTHK